MGDESETEYAPHLPDGWPTGQTQPIPKLPQEFMSHETEEGQCVTKTGLICTHSIGRYKGNHHSRFPAPRETHLSVHIARELKHFFQMDIVKLIEPCIRVVMCLLGILGNSWLAIRTLPSRRSRLRTNEALFLNLAISNLITNVLVDVPDTMSEFAGVWFLGNIYCKMYWFFSDLSETSSIFSTLLISLFWYQKLVWSLKRGGAPVALDSLRLIALLLAGSWVVAVLFSFPNLIYGVVETKNQTAAECIVEFPSQKAKEIYEITYLTLANVVPISGILFASVQIVVTLLRHQKRIQGVGADPTPAPQTLGPEGSSLPGGTAAGGAKNIPPPRPSKPTPNADTQVRAAKSKVAVASIFLVCWLTHLLSRIYNNVNESSVVMDVASYAGSSYTTIIPYIFLYGIRKLTCSCRG